MKKNTLLVSLLLVVSMLFAACGTTQKPAEQKPGEQKPAETQTKWPEKPINLIIQAAPGGLSDTTARTVGTELQKILGVPVIASNKPGAAGAVAMSFVRQSAADGYTIGYVPVELSMVKALGYAEDVEPSAFTLLGASNISPATITVSADSQFKTLKDLVDYAKANPGKLKVGNSGTGSIWHIAAESFAKAAGVEFNHVPFDGATPAIAAVMGKHIDVVPVSVMEVKSGVESGKLRVLAVLSADKSEYLPDVPTAKELGYDINVAAWGGFAAPKNLPEDVKAKLIPAIQQAINSQALKDVAQQRGFTVFSKSAEDFTKFAQEQFDFYMKQIPAMGIKANK